MTFTCRTCKVKVSIEFENGSSSAPFVYCPICKSMFVITHGPVPVRHDTWRQPSQSPADYFHMDELEHFTEDQMKQLVGRADHQNAIDFLWQLNYTCKCVSSMPVLNSPFCGACRRLAPDEESL